MRKIIPIFLSITLLLSITFTMDFNHTVSAFENEEITFQVDTFMELDDKGEMLEGDKNKNKKNLSNSYITFDTIDFSLTDGHISGTVEYFNNEIVGFDLVGDLKNRGMENDSIIISDMKDTLGNFDVIYAGLSNDPSKMNIFDKQRYNKNDDSIKSLMTLVLMEKGTRRLTIAEWYNPSIDIDSIVSNQTNIPKAEKEDILWHRKLLKTESILYKDEVETSDTLDIMGYHPVITSTINFYNWYDYWGETYRQQLTIRHGLETTTDLAYSESMSGWIKVMDSKTVCETNSAYSFSDSYLSLGRGGDGFKFAEWDVIGETAPEIKVGADIDLSYSVEVPYVPISFSIAATLSEDLDLNQTYSSFPNDSSNLTRALDVSFNKEYMISDINDLYIVDFVVHKYDQTIHDDGEINFKYSYFVWDQYAWDHQSHSSTLTGYYTSN